MVMAVNSKQKGARFERLLASKFRECGYADSRRTAQYCGNTGDASDVVGLPGLHIEAKHQETMRLYDWVDQAKRDAKANGKGNLPAVFHKKNNAEILVTMPFDDFMRLYREYELNLTEIDNAEHCACCGAVIPEGRQVCPACERSV
jgi:Holliday junction resolvase